MSIIDGDHIKIYQDAPANKISAVNLKTGFEYSIDLFQFRMAARPQVVKLNRPLNNSELFDLIKIESQYVGYYDLGLNRWVGSSELLIGT